MTEEMRADDGIAERFLKIRDHLKVNQRDFAGEIGVSYSVISDIERGAREPSRKVLVALGEKYGVSLDWVLLGIGTMFAKCDRTLYSEKESLEWERLEREIAELKKSIGELERENKDLSKELLERMRELLNVRKNLGHLPS